MLGNMVDGIVKSSLLTALMASSNNIIQSWYVKILLKLQQSSQPQGTITKSMGELSSVWFWSCKAILQLWQSKTFCFSWGRGMREWEYDSCHVIFLLGFGKVNLENNCLPDPLGNTAPHSCLWPDRFVCAKGWVDREGEGEIRKGGLCKMPGSEPMLGISTIAFPQKARGLNWD